MGIRMLLNEHETIERDQARIHFAGIDDAHFFRADNIEKAASTIPSDEFSILLSHTPEVYQQAAHAGFDLLLSGRTHGGQICLPGRIPISWFSASQIYGFWRLEISRDDRVHVGWRWLVRRSHTFQLPPGSHAALSATQRLTTLARACTGLGLGVSNTRIWIAGGDYPVDLTRTTTPHISRDVRS
jgi:uncharacterized protein